MRENDQMLVGGQSQGSDYDVFICHASTDKEPVARPLALELRKHGLRVWFDEFEVLIGDSLRRKIEDGLARSRFGVVVLSPAFFTRQWSQQELDGLAQREMVDGKVVILPVLFELDINQVTAKSPMLGSKASAFWADGLTEVVDQILRRLETSQDPSGSNASSATISEAELASAKIPTLYPRRSYALTPDKYSEAHLTFRTATVFQPSNAELLIEPGTRKLLERVLAESSIPIAPGAEWHRPPDATQNTLVAVRTVDCQRNGTADCWVALPHLPNSSNVVVAVDLNFPGDVRLTLAEACRAWASTYSTGRAVGDRVLPELGDNGLKAVKIELHVDAGAPGLSEMIDLTMLGETSNTGFMQGTWSGHPGLIDDERVLDLIVRVMRSNALDWGFEDPDSGIHALSVELGVRQAGVPQ